MALIALLVGFNSYLLRLHLQPGDVIDYSLKVVRQNPSETGEIREHVVIASVANGVITMRIALTGMTINGKDRTSDLRAVIGNQTVTMPWTDLSKRTGEMSGLSIRPGGAKDVMALLVECGIYACDFPVNAAQRGDSWPGSTTATGGCTSGTYTLKDVVTKNGKTFAFINVTDIAMASSAQVGPMQMTVDLSHGLPTYVGYTVRDRQTGRTSKFEETMTSFKRAP